MGGCGVVQVNYIIISFEQDWKGGPRGKSEVYKKVEGKSLRTKHAGRRWGRGLLPFHTRGGGLGGCVSEVDGQRHLSHRRASRVRPRPAGPSPSGFSLFNLAGSGDSRSMGDTP